MPVCTDEHAHTLANTCTHTRNPHPTPHTQTRARTHAPPLTHTQTRSHAHTHTRKQAHTHTHSHTYLRFLYMLEWTGKPCWSVPVLSVYTHVPPTPGPCSKALTEKRGWRLDRCRTAHSPAAPAPTTATRIDILTAAQNSIFALPVWYTFFFFLLLFFGFCRLILTKNFSECCLILNKKIFLPGSYEF